MDASRESVLQWLFGREGSVADEIELRVAVTATAIAVTGSFLVSPIISALTGPFAVSEAAVGQLITAFTAPSVLLVPVFGVLADRYGYRVVLVFGLLAIGIGGGLIALAPSFEVALGLRLVQGVGYAAVNPVGVAIIGDAYSGSREVTAQGLRVTGIQTVGLVVPAVSGALVVLSWQYPFLLYFLAVPISVWAWVSLPPVAAEQSTSLRGYLRNLRSSLSTPALGAVVLSFIPRFSLSFSMVAYISVLLARLGTSSVAIGVLVGLIGLVSMVSSTQAGRVTDRFYGTPVLLAAFVLFGTGMVTLGIAGSLPLVLIGVLGVGIAQGLSGPVQKSLVTQLSPPAIRGGAVSSAVTFQSVGAAGGPFLMGVGVQYLGVGPVFVAFGLGFGALGVGLTLITHFLQRDAAALTG